MNDCNFSDPLALSSELSGVAGDREAIGGVTKLGHLGVNLCVISDTDSRSAGRSTAGGWELREAAARITVKPIPSSASANRRSVTIRSSPAVAIRRTVRKFAAPRANSITNITVLA